MTSRTDKIKKTLEVIEINSITEDLLDDIDNLPVDLDKIFFKIILYFENLEF
jgi:hypothetical protein